MAAGGISKAPATRPAHGRRRAVAVLVGRAGKRLAAIIILLFIGLLYFVAFLGEAFAQQSPAAPGATPPSTLPVAAPGADAKETASPAESKSDATATSGDPEPITDLTAEQRRVSAKFRELEKVILRMAEVTAQTDPRRAALLRRAFLRSKEKQLDSRFDKLVKLIESDEFYQAGKSQAEVQKELRGLLDLLMTGDRDKQLENEQQRIKKYISQVNRLIREQQSLQGETEGQSDSKHVEEQQQKLADKTDNLLKEIEKHDGDKSKNAADQDSPSDEQRKKDADSKESKQSDPGEKSEQKSPGESDQSGDSDEKAGREEKSPRESEKSGDKQSSGKDGQPSDKKDSENKDADRSDKKSAQDNENKEGGEQKSEGQKSDEKEGKESGEGADQGEKDDGKKSDKSSDGESEGGAKKSSKQSPSEGSESSPSEGGESSESESSESESASKPQAEETPGRRKIAAAQQKMKAAEKKLKEAKRRDAVKDQEDAIEQLQQAKAELEKILRQMREEEVERALAQLETRFRKILTMQTEVMIGTVQLHKVAAKEQTREHQIEAGRLAKREQEIIAETDRAQNLLREEGSAVAFPEAVSQMREDMTQVASRLSATNLGPLTQGLEADIVAALEEMIAALQKAQKELKDKKQMQAAGGGGGQGENPLVDQLAELKMIRALQKRVNQRTERYSKLLRSGAEQADQPDLVIALQKLSERQQRIHQSTRDIVLGKNK